MVRSQTPNTVASCLLVRGKPSLAQAAIGIPDQINRVTPSVILAVPLCELRFLINPTSVEGDPGMRHIAVDMAAQLVLQKLNELGHSAS